MKFIPLHTKTTSIVYKNALCSSAALVVLVFIVLSVMVPVLLVSLLSPYSGIVESRVLYEQPRLQFQFQSIFLARTGGSSEQLVVCSTFPGLNEQLHHFGRSCAGSKYSSEDMNHDGLIDRAHFQLTLDDVQAVIKSFDLVLFFEAGLQHKCDLSPPAVLAHRLTIPEFEQLAGAIHLKAELQLKQNMEFICPFPGHNTKTHFRHVKINANNSAVDLKQFQLESLLKQVKANYAYFELQVQETYFRRGRDYRAENLQIHVDVDVVQVPARYHLSVWERLGQFWLYFASFFGISFYIMNKLKDILFARQIIRSWEIIPWKKSY